MSFYTRLLLPSPFRPLPLPLDSLFELCQCSIHARADSRVFEFAPPRSHPNEHLNRYSEERNIHSLLIAVHRKHGRDACPASGLCRRKITYPVWLDRVYDVFHPLHQLLLSSESTQNRRHRSPVRQRLSTKHAHRNTLHANA